MRWIWECCISTSAFVLQRNIRGIGQLVARKYAIVMSETLHVSSLLLVISTVDPSARSFLAYDYICDLSRCRYLHHRQKARHERSIGRPYPRILSQRHCQSRRKLIRLCLLCRVEENYVVKTLLVPGEHVAWVRGLAMHSWSRNDLQFRMVWIENYMYKKSQRVSHLIFNKKLNAHYMCA